MTQLTFVTPEELLTPEMLRERILKTHREHAREIQAFHEAWYNSDHTWTCCSFLGVSMMKNPFDLWTYQELITRLQPRLIIETGTYAGGSALWFAYLMDMLNIDGRVFSIDIENRRRCEHPRVTFIEADSTDPATRDAVLTEVYETRGVMGRGPVLISLDADHSAEHVRKELELWAPLTQPGDRIVVEDTNIGWGGPGGDRGAQGGVVDYLNEHPGELVQDLLCEKYLLTMNPGGWLVRVHRCKHA